MTVINSNMPARKALRHLSNAENGVAASYEILSSGRRINRAADDAAGLNIAETLRADSRVFTQGVRNLNDGVSYLNVAEAATQELSGILSRMRELATQMSNGTYTDQQRQAADAEVQALVNEHNRIVEAAEYNGTRIFAQTNQRIALQCGYGLNERLTVWLGGESSGTSAAKGDGTFGARATFKTGTGPLAVISADFNGDQVLDVATADRPGQSVSVLIGNGNGTFAAPTILPSALFSGSLVAGDFDSDEILDIAAAGIDAAGVRLFSGNGNGTFKASHAWIPTSNWQNSIAAADVDGDQLLDLITAPNSKRVDVFLGNGNGTFSAKTTFQAGRLPYGMALGRIDGDTAVDIVVANYADKSLSLLLGNGNGTFAAAISLSAGGFPAPVTLADFDGDTIIDISFGTQTGIGLLIGNGDGTFRSTASYQIPASAPLGMSTVDFNGDGALDLATGHTNSQRMNILLGNGNGTFQASVSYQTGSMSGPLTAGDFNGDTAFDVAVANYSGTVGIFLANTTPGQAATDSGIGTISGISVATQALALAAQDLIDSLSDDVGTIRSRLGADASRIEKARSNLLSRVENVEAAHGRIVDGDLAEESSKLLRMTILKQVGAAILAQANQQLSLAVTLLRDTG